MRSIAAEDVVERRGKDDPEALAILFGDVAVWLERVRDIALQWTRERQRRVKVVDVSRHDRRSAIQQNDVIIPNDRDVNATLSCEEEVGVGG